ncbi:MAG: hypothetical protein ACK56I_22700, partial [bacterium]
MGGWGWGKGVFGETLGILRRESRVETLGIVRREVPPEGFVLWGRGRLEITSFWPCIVPNTPGAHSKCINAYS